MFCKILQRNLKVYELVSISSKLFCLLPELGSYSSFVACIIVVWFSTTGRNLTYKMVNIFSLFSDNFFIGMVKNNVFTGLS